MPSNLDRILPIGAALALLLWGVAAAQEDIPVVSSPTYGQVSMAIGSGGYAPSWNVYGPSPEHAISFFMPSEYTAFCNGKGFAGRAYLSGDMACGPDQNRASVGGAYFMGLYGEAVPGSNVRVKIQSHLEVSWNGLGQESRVYFIFGSTASDVNRMSQSVLINGTIIKNGEVSSMVVPQASTALNINGRTMYRLGTLEIYANLGLHNAGTSADYNGRVTGFSARYVGKVLSKVDGDSQTGLVKKELPKALVVRVADGETGAVPPNVPITFTIVEPSNGAKFSNDQTSITDVTENGLAAVKLTLGSAAGNYTIKATCPAEVCTSGAKEAVFIEKAVTVQQATKLTEMFCDGAHFLGRPLSNPLRVTAINLYTNKGESGFEVVFSQEGIVRGTMDESPVVTGPEGVAGKDFTVGDVVGVYKIKAYCANCLAGQTVSCIVKGVAAPHGEHENPAVDINKRRRGVNITLEYPEVYPLSAGGTPTETLVTITGAAPNTPFTAQVVAGANTGGHQHHDKNRPKGILSGVGGTCTGADILACATASNGYAQLKYVSSEVGGWDNILVKMATGEVGDAIVKVRVPGLLPLPQPNMNYIRDTGDETHPNYLYGSPGFVNVVQQIAAAYRIKYGEILSFNDMSLINGGLFDVGGSWTTPHKSHRAGKDVDFNTTTFYRKNGVLYKVENLTVPELLVRIKTVISENGFACNDVKEETIHIRCD